MGLKVFPNLEFFFSKVILKVLDDFALGILLLRKRSFKKVLILST